MKTASVSEAQSAPLERALRALSASPDPRVRSLFDPEHPITVARAPARLDLMGGIADYSGSLVLEWPLACGTHAALQPSGDGRIRVVSAGPKDERVFECEVSSFGDPDEGYYARARAFFASEPTDAWAAYALGPLLVLAREHHLDLTPGLRILLASDVPEGKGVSSSAAVEVAVMAAARGLYRLDLPDLRAALLCQLAENHVVGAPCGVMDPIAVGCGREGRLLALRCQPAELLGTIALPSAWAVFGIDSGVRHAVTGTDYREVRTAAFMGHRLLLAHAGRGAEDSEASKDLSGFRVHLANLTPSLLASAFSGVLPETMRGADFLAEHGDVHDPLTSVDPARTYRVRAATEHPVHEHLRVRTFASLLGAEASEETASLLGELMMQSHVSYSRVGLGSEATDRIVARVHAAGPRRGLYGAKITGGGSGGTVAILARRDAEAEVHAIAAAHAAEFGVEPVVFAGSSKGAFEDPVRTSWMHGGAR